MKSFKSYADYLEEGEASCPPATQDLAINTENRDATIKNYNYGPLNVDEPGDYWEKIAKYWDTTVEAAKKSVCANCVAFDISPRMLDCMPGETSDDDGVLGYCWMHHFKCHSARSCHTWAKGGPIDKDDVSIDWAKRAGEPYFKEATERIPRKKGQHTGSSSHSDLYTDEDPEGTIHGLGFKDAEAAKKGIEIIGKSDRTHAHKVQATLVMQQRAKVAMGRTKDPEKKANLSAAYEIWTDHLEKLKKITQQKNEDTVEEGVNDPAIFKAVFLAGGPGSGKSFTVGKTALTSLGFKIVNSDDKFEAALAKAGLEATPDNIYSPQGQALRGRAKELTAKQQELYIKGRLGLVVDGTGKDYSKIKKQALAVKSLGYDVAMIFVNTDLDTALKRNRERARNLPDDKVKRMWNEVQGNLGKFQSFFGSNFIIVDNSEGSNIEKATLSAYKKMSQFSKQSPQNVIAKNWIKSQQEVIEGKGSKGKYKGETWEQGYERRVVKTTKPEHIEKGFKWRIKGKKRDEISIRLYKDKPDFEEFTKQMKRVAGWEFGG